MQVFTCQYMQKTEWEVHSLSPFPFAGPELLVKSMQGSGTCEDELPFSPLTHTLQYAGLFFFFSSSSFTLL